MRELAEVVAGVVVGDADREISGVAPVDEAGPEHLTYVAASRYERHLETRRPGAALVPRDLTLDAPGTALIRVPDPQRAFARLAVLFHPPQRSRPGIAPTALIGRGTVLRDGVSIGPFAVIADDVDIGEGTAIGPHAVIESGVRIGADCTIASACTILRGVRMGDRVQLHPGVRLGTEGFGYTTGADGHSKVPQIGGCVIGDDVEIGANSTIDRGSIGDTVIGAGTKIDNLVHIGHNVRIGRHCVIVAQVGVAGSVRIGDGVQLAGQAGIAGHLTIGDGARVGAQAGVIGDVPAGASYSGYPARPHRESMRASAALRRLPEAFQRLHRLERFLGTAGEADGGSGGAVDGGSGGDRPRGRDPEDGRARPDVADGRAPPVPNGGDGPDRA